MTIRETILSAERKRPIEAVATPEWPECDGDVFVRHINSHDFNDWAAETVDEKGDQDFENMHAKFAVRCACDKDGCLLFQKADVEALGNEPAGVINRIWNAGRKLSKIDDETDLAKNSEPTTDAASPSS